MEPVGHAKAAAALGGAALQLGAAYGLEGSTAATGHASSLNTWFSIPQPLMACLPDHPGVVAVEFARGDPPPMTLLGIRTFWPPIW